MDTNYAEALNIDTESSIQTSLSVVPSPRPDFLGKAISGNNIPVSNAGRPATKKAPKKVEEYLNEVDYC